MINCRFLLDLRQVNDRPDHVSTVSLSTFHVNIPSNLLGNLGETLEGPFDLDEAEQTWSERDEMELLEERAKRNDTVIRIVRRARHH